MSAAASRSERAALAMPRAPSRPGVRVRDIERAERRKLTAQLSTRVLALVCALGPFAFAGLLHLQNGLPADTLFGVWARSSGYAASLVVLGFSGTWGFPVIAGVLAGDVFSGEDRHGTWKTVLTRSARRRDVFAGKVVAVAELTILLVAVTAISSIVGGLAFAGSTPLVGLSGTVLSPGHSLELVVAAWAVSILPALAFASLGLMFSLATRNGIAGAIGPVLVALVMQLLDLIGNGVTVHAALVGSSFSDWHGLFVAHPFLGPLLVGSAVSVVWIVGGLAICARMLRRRDFAGAGATRAARWTRAGAGAVMGLVIVGLLAGGTALGPGTITAQRLQSSLAPAFNRLALLQQRELGRAVPAGSRLRISPSCLRHGSAGPGDDWTCTLDVFIPQGGIEPFQQTAVTYDMSVQSNGCWKADSPPAFVGQQLMRDGRGREVVNPLYTIYGCFATDG